jgi:hypothetical protein
MTSWEKFIVDKPNWDLSNAIESLNIQMQLLIKFKREISS